MALDSNIVGGVSGNKAEVDANGAIKTNLPTDKADAGYVALTSIVHDGASGQATPIVRNLEVSINKRLRVGLDNLWFEVKVKDGFTPTLQFGTDELVDVTDGSLHSTQVYDVPPDSIDVYVANQSKWRF